MFPGLDLYYTEPAQPLTTAREELHYLDHDLSDLSVQGVQLLRKSLQDRPLGVNRPAEGTLKHPRAPPTLIQWSLQARPLLFSPRESSSTVPARGHFNSC